jgi:GDP-L-fucose synthase
MPKLKVYVAGHNGMVGSSLVRFLKKKKNLNILTRDKSKLNLTSQTAVHRFFKKEKIDQVYLAAAKVGGIYANNTFPADFIYENLMIQTNIIHSAFLNGVKKLLFLGSSCIYPKNAKQPMKEDDLLTGKLEPTNEPYAIAKIAGIKMCESYNRQYGNSHGIDYRCIMPTNLYGPGDSYNENNSHVIPSLILRFHKAKINNDLLVNVWGSGKPKREFLYVDDMARAAIYLMNLKQSIYNKHVIKGLSYLNAGSGEEIAIKNLAQIIKKIVGYKGKIKFDLTMPDGSPRKFLDSKHLNNLGWLPKINLKKGLQATYKDFKVL